MPLVTISIGCLLLTPLPLLAANGSGEQGEQEFLWYFVLLAVWVLLAVLAVSAWPIYLLICRRRARKLSQVVAAPPPATAISPNGPTHHKSESIQSADPPRLPGGEEVGF